MSKITVKILKQLCRDHIPPIKGFSKLKKMDLINLLKSYNVVIPESVPKIKKTRIIKKKVIKELPDTIKENIEMITNLRQERKQLIKKYDTIKNEINKINEELKNIGSGIQRNKILYRKHYNIN
jgi:mevalonate kinase